MNNKKAILKKYTGQGGIIGDTISRGISGIKNKYNEVKTNVQDGITKGIVNFVGDTPAGKILKSGLEKQKQQKLKKAISPVSTTAPLIKTMPDIMPLRSIPKMPNRMPKVPDLMPKKKKTPSYPKYA